MKSPIGWEKDASKYSTSKTPSTTPTPHTHDPSHTQTIRESSPRCKHNSQLRTYQHCIAQQANWCQKKMQTRKFPTLASKRTVHAKLARGSHMNLGHYMPDCQTKMQTQIRPTLANKRTVRKIVQDFRFWEAT